MIVLITGGSGCGKSYYAERLIRRLANGHEMYYIATMDAYDDESKMRVLRHQTQRKGLGFHTIEQPLSLDAVEIPSASAAIVECVPTLLSNEMFLAGGRVDSIPLGIKQLCGTCAELVVVTNDVFSDGQVYDAATEAYKRLLARINREIAGMADCVIEVVYSIPVAVKGALP